MDSLIILDRGSDLLTPMCTQLTYEGLVDEMYGINSSTSCIRLNLIRVAFVPVNPSMLGAPVAGQGSKPKKVPLNATDKLFSQIRNLNFAVVGNVLSQNAKRLFEDYEVWLHN